MCDQKAKTAVLWSSSSKFVVTWSAFSVRSTSLPTKLQTTVCLIIRLTLNKSEICTDIALKIGTRKFVKKLTAHRRCQGYRKGKILKSQLKPSFPGLWTWNADRLTVESQLKIVDQGSANGFRVCIPRTLL